MSLYLGENLISGVVTPIEPTRNIGQIVTSTIPLTDAGLHLLDGSLLDGTGIYKDFYDYMVNVYNNYPHLFCTEEQWQQYVAADGACNRFVLNTTNKTIRLGLLTGFIEGTNNISDLGALTLAGLPNITGTLPGENPSVTNWWDKVTGSFYKTSTSGQAGFNANQDNDNIDVGFDASRSSSIYGNSTTVQPQAIKVLYYIVIATSTKTDIEVDIDQIATDLNNKVDKNDLTTVHCVVETYQNGTSWYRIYDDGWCEQGGYQSTPIDNFSTFISFLLQFTNTNYTIILTQSRTNSNNWQTVPPLLSYSKITTGVNTQSQGSEYLTWYACGYIS